MNPPAMPSSPQWSSKSPESSAIGGDKLALFALNATAELGGKVAMALGRPLAAHEERTFEDGEHKTRPLESVGGKDVYVVQSLHGGPNESAHDKLCRLLFFIGALKDAGAAAVTAVVPYLCYARKDRRTKPQDPVTMRYVAELFDAMGTAALVSLEVHNPVAFENAFRCRTVTLTGAPLFIAHLAPEPAERLVVASPDPGGVKRADLFREALETARGQVIGKAFVDKRRSAGVVSGDTLVGAVEDATVVIIDDLISTGNTLARAARAARQAGARRVIALASHGLFMTGAAEALADPAIERVVVTDTVPAFRLPAGPVRGKLDILPTAPLLAEAIRRLHQGRLLSDLLVF